MADFKAPHETRVAVIGAGPQGLCALKNLLEEDFDATLFEARDVIGGLWAFSDDPNVMTTLETTVTNASKLRNVYADFPCDKGFPLFANRREFLEYLEAYADHFGLKKRIQFGKRLVGLKRVTAKDGRALWRLDFINVKSKGEEKTVELFDKVIVAIGRHHSANMPQIEGSQHFGKRIIHAAQFKDPQQYKDRDVLILGFASTAADTATELIGIAQSLCVSSQRHSYLSAHSQGQADRADSKPENGCNNGLAGFVVPRWDGEVYGQHGREDE